jgi:AcrR family transcriptional regulator
MSQTALSRRLRGEIQEKPDALTAFKVSRRWFMDGRKLDMGELAETLGVSRATLFRWVGNRDQLVSEICMDLCAKTFQRAWEDNAGAAGAERVAAVVGAFVNYLAGAGYYCDFIRAEPERGLRIATTKAFPIQRLVIAEVERLLGNELGDPGGAPAQLSHHDLAFLIVRIAESVLYTDVITGEPPKPEIAEQAVRALIGSQAVLAGARSGQDNKRRATGTQNHAGSASGAVRSGRSSRAN